MSEPVRATSSRRDLLRSVVGASLLGGMPLAISTAEAATGVRSGIAWQSGAGIGGYAAFASYRGRLLDTITCWCPSDTWTDVISFKGGFTTARKSRSRVSCAIVPLPKSHDGRLYPENWKLAASGTFDGYYAEFAMRLRDAGLTDVVCRIGWETNGSSRCYFCGTDGPAFVATWQRIATILRQYNPTIKTEWCNIKKGAQKSNIMNYYPGDAYVDIIGVNYYDGWPALSTQAIWDKQYYASYLGGPWGLGAWAAEARSRGKQLACSEWGVNAGRYGCVDNPLYIENMHNFFVANGDIMAYENYFNQKIYHTLTTINVNPLSSAKYKQLWGVTAV